MIAMAIVPVAVVLFRRAMLARRPRLALNRACVVALAPAALAILCIASLHTSELPLVVFLPLLLVFEQAWRDHDGRLLVPALARGIAVGALAMVLFAPTLVSFFGGVSERRRRANVRRREPGELGAGARRDPPASPRAAAPFARASWRCSPSRAPRSG